MQFTKKNQPAWPFPQKGVDVSTVIPKQQPKAAYRDHFSQSVLPWQTSWADSLFGKKGA